LRLLLLAVARGCATTKKPSLTGKVEIDTYLGRWYNCGNTVYDRPEKERKEKKRKRKKKKSARNVRRRSEITWKCCSLCLIIKNG
jgi:lipocalin